MNVVVGIATRVAEGNELLDRCMKSLREKEAGIRHDFILELGDMFTRGEKRQRIFAQAKDKGARWVCILEDDTEVISEGWLGQMVWVGMSAAPNVGIVNPSEARYGSDEPTTPITSIVSEIPTAFGFCMLYNMDYGPRYDPRIMYLDDFAMSMQARAAGYRILVCSTSIVRHTKQPFLSDDTPPWQQTDRSRWGQGDRYYDAKQFHERRMDEAKIILDEYGDMARPYLPKELLYDPVESEIK